MESEEDTGEFGQMWISTRSILDAADINKTYKKLSQVSECSSFTREYKPQLVNDSVSFNFLHQNYCEDESFSWDEDMFSSQLYCDEGLKK